MTMRTGILILTLLMAGAAEARVSATVDRNEITEFDVLQLTIRVSGTTEVPTPDFSPIERDFEIINRQSRQSSSISYVNGRQVTTSHRDFVLSLRARGKGELSIPPLTIAGEQTSRIPVRVVEQSPSVRRQMNQLVFFETDVDTTETYVQGQVVYTVRLFYAETISGDFPPPPSIEGAVVETIEAERRYESIVDNRRYFVLEKQYAVFPQQSGTLTIPRETFVGTRGRGGLFSARQRVNAVSSSHDVRVKPIPASFPPGQWLAAGEIKLREEWSESGPLRVGEPINRTVTLIARGVPTAQLPMLPELDSGLAKTYMDPPELTEYVDSKGRGIVGMAKTTVGIVPVADGKLELPEIRIPWWNTETDQLEYAVIPGRAFLVLPSTEAEVSTPAVPTTPIGESQGSDIDTVVATPAWMWLALLILAAGWATTATLLWRTRQQIQQHTAPVQPTGNRDEQVAFRNLEQACRAGNAAAAAHALGVWVRSLPGHPLTVTQLAKQTGDDALTTALAELETMLFAPGDHGTWQGERLLTICRRVRQSETRDGRARRPALEPGLNPVAASSGAS